MVKLSHHDHTHVHGSGTEGKDKNLVLLSFTYDHNVHHTEEMNELIEVLRESGKTDVCALVEQAQAKFREGNEILHHAIHHYEEG